MPLTVKEPPMTRLLWLPEVLRAAGLTVREVDGWRTRGSSTYEPRGIICHATAGSRASTDAGEIRVLLNGSSTAPPPIAQLFLSRSGAFHVVASGKCFHALTGWGGPLKGLGNTNLIGIEAANDNRGEPWPPAQLDAYQRGVAAICKRMGWTAARNVAAHREHQPYPPPPGTTSSKSDPHGIDMTAFRARVTQLIAGEDIMASLAELRSVVQQETAPIRAAVDYVDGRVEALAHGRDTVRAGLRGAGQPVWTVQAIKLLADAVAKVDDQVAAQLADDFARLDAAVAAAGELDPAAIAEAIPAGIAAQVVDELSRRIAATSAG